MARITFTTMYDSTIRNLQRNANKLNKLEEQVMTGVRLNRPSDNPVGFTNTLSYRNKLNSLEQERVNMDDGSIYMTALENTHNALNNIFTRSKELATQMANDTYGEDERRFALAEVHESLEQMVGFSQVKHKDGYMFSGKWTNQPPYEIKSATPTFFNINAAGAQVFGAPPLNGVLSIKDSNYDDPNLDPPPNNHPVVQRIIPGSLKGMPVNALGEPLLKEGVDYDVDYAEGTIRFLTQEAVDAFDPAGTPPGISIDNLSFQYIYRNSIDMSGEIYREIDTGITMKINANPDDLFGKDGKGQTDSFKEMISFMQGLWLNDQPKIAEGIDRINDARTRNLEQQTIEGARLSRIDIVFSRNKELDITNSDAQDRIESTRIDEALTDLMLADAVYSASLQAASRLIRPTLANYLS